MLMNDRVNSTCEVYWLLDRVLDDLAMVNQLLYDKYEPYERLLLLSILAFSGITNDNTKINDLIKYLESSRWKAQSWSISFNLGILARDYIRKKHNILPNVRDY